MDHSVCYNVSTLKHLPIATIYVLISTKGDFDAHEKRCIDEPGLDLHIS